jgi:hypothetical protein
MSLGFSLFLILDLELSAYVFIHPYLYEQDSFEDLYCLWVRIGGAHKERLGHIGTALPMSLQKRPNLMSKHVCVFAIPCLVSTNYLLEHDLVNKK